MYSTSFKKEFTKLALNRTAIIIKGNPKYIKDNIMADKFYQDLKNFLEEQKYIVKFDAGKPYTLPEKATVWVGHSRGADRLDFAPKEIKTIAIGAPFNEESINHSKDNVKTFDSKKPYKPNKYHFILTDEMKEKILTKL